MKKLIFALVLAVSFTGFAQDVIVEGIVKSKQTMTSDNEQMQAQLAMVGDVLTTTYFKGNKTRSETFNLMSGSTTTIIDGDTKDMLMYMDNQMTGKVYATENITPTEKDLEGVQVTKGTGTKTILGYTCQEYNVTMDKNGAKVNMSVYVTDKIEAMNSQVAQLGQQIEGFPLYMKMDVAQAGMALTITNEVTEVKKAEVADDKFIMKAPEGYTKTDNLGGM
ncbi:DUF4412 domain-containing protein [Bizionia sediminis]|uniref:DUF4412 domain-containing protein n=1 Tax=Bizionia sediminis TaxID=1737064 RepID=A0ABW5KN77_9FLAO